MTQKLQYAIDFATTCVKHDIKLGLKALNHKNQTNENNHAKAKNQLVLAKQLGYSISFMRNWPSLFKNGADIYLPQ